jgi:prepilin-type N-terminal cleavage/methylation domain-containing protein
MPSRARARGFSLIEALLVLAIIGIISAIAIPSYLGQRRRARVVGDAMANAKVMAIMLESQKADTGVYGSGGPYTWSASGSAQSVLPNFSPSGNTQMSYKLEFASSGLAYTITVTDPTLGVTAYQTDQTGAQLQRLF